MRAKRALVALQASLLILRTKRHYSPDMVLVCRSV